MGLTIETVTDDFRNPIIRKHKLVLERASSKEIENFLQENSMPTSTELGGGNYGCLGLTMSETKFIIASTHSFMAHDNPGSTPPSRYTDLLVHMQCKSKDNMQLNKDFKE